MPAEIPLVIQSDRQEEYVAELTRDLSNDLKRQSMLKARQRTRPPEPGEKAVDVTLIGQLLISFLTNGAAKALIDCLRPFFARDRTLRVIIKRPDGTEVEISGNDLRPERIEAVTSALATLEPTEARG